MLFKKSKQESSSNKLFMHAYLGALFRLNCGMKLHVGNEI